MAKKPTRRAASHGASELAQMIEKSGKRPRGKPRGRAFPGGNKLGRKFQKGQPSANPGGRPSAKEFKESCQDAAPEVLEFWIAVGTGKRKASTAQVRAGEMVVAHAQFQKATQKIGGDPESPIPLAGLGIERLAKMTTGAMRRELEALRRRREEMTGKKPPPEEAPAAPAPDAAPSDSKP